jgi:hypothetical protein
MRDEEHISFSYNHVQSEFNYSNFGTCTYKLFYNIYVDIYNQILGT